MDFVNTAAPTMHIEAQQASLVTAQRTPGEEARNFLTMFAQIQLKTNAQREALQTAIDLCHANDSPVAPMDQPRARNQFLRYLEQTVRRTSALPEQDVEAQLRKLGESLAVLDKPFALPQPERSFA